FSAFEALACCIAIADAGALCCGSIFHVATIRVRRTSVTGNFWVTFSQRRHSLRVSVEPRPLTLLLRRRTGRPVSQGDMTLSSECASVLMRTVETGNEV